MCEVRWVRSNFVGTEFHRWYFELAKPPTKNPSYMYVIHPIYAEFAEQPLVSVLVQLRDALPVDQRTEVDKAVEWVGTWNPDIWEGKSFDEQKKIARDHLWLSRWK